MNEYREPNTVFFNKDEADLDKANIFNKTSDVQGSIKSPKMENKTIKPDFESSEPTSKFDFSSEELIKKLAFNKNSEKDPRRFIKITEIVEINDFLETDTNNSIKPCCEFTLSNQSKTKFNLQSRKIGPSVPMSYSHSFDSQTWQNEKSSSKEIPIKFEKSESSINKLTEPVQNTEIVLEILNTINSLDMGSKKPKKIIVKITGRTRSTDPFNASNKNNLGKKEVNYQNQYLNQHTPFKPNPVKIGNRVPYYNFKPISKEDSNKKNDQYNDYTFDLNKFKSYFNTLNKSSSNRSISMPPIAKPNFFGSSQIENKLDFTNDVFQKRSCFRKINKNLDRDYACSDSEDSIWAYRNKNDNLKKNFVRSNSTMFDAFSNDDTKNSFRECSSPSSYLDSSNKNRERFGFYKRKDVDLYQESLRRNFAKSDKKFDPHVINDKNTKNISSYYNKYYSHINDLNKKKIDDSKNGIAIFNQQNPESDLTNTYSDHTTDKIVNDTMFFEKSVTHFNHNNKQCLSTFLPINNYPQTSHFRSRSNNNSPNKFTKQARRVNFADDSV